MQVKWSHVCKALCSLGREPSAVILKSMKWGMTAALSFPEGFGNTDGVRDGRGFANGRAQFTREGHEDGLRSRKSLSLEPCWSKAPRGGGGGGEGGTGLRKGKTPETQWGASQGHGLGGQTAWAQACLFLSLLSVTLGKQPWGKAAMPCW